MAPAAPSPTPPADGAGGAGSGHPVHLTPLHEMQLLEAHRHGDRQALEALLRAYQPRVYAICYRMLGDAEEARDLAQDALVKILEGLDGYDGRSKLSTWVFRVTANCCLSHLRKQKLRRHASLDDGPPSGPVARPHPAGGGELLPGDRVERRELRSRLLAALGALDPPLRAILVLRDLHDLDYSQIADVLDLPVGTVKSRLFRARTALRAAVEAAEEGDAAAPGPG